MSNSLSHVVTEEDLKNNPEWVDNGIKVGDTIELEEPETKPTKAKSKAKPKVDEEEVAQPKPLRKQKSLDYVLTGNIKHDGVRYEKGMVVPTDHPLFDVFEAAELLE